MDEIIEVQPVEAASAWAIAPSKEIRVEFMPASIADNIEAVEAYIDEQLEPFVGAKLDPDDEEQIKQGRQFMADLNKLKKPIEDERKRIKREYEKPLKAFEARVKQITGKIDEARGNLKQQVDAADEAFKEQRRAMLAEEYEGCVGDFATVVPFAAILEKEWLNRSTQETKAVNAMTDKAVKALEGYQTIQRKELNHKTEVVRLYCETLDMVRALQLEDELNEEDRKRADFERRQRELEEARARREAEAYEAEMREQRAETEAEAFAEAIEAADPAVTASTAAGSVFVADKPAPEAEQPAQATTAASPEVFTWGLSLEFVGTKQRAQALANLLKSEGITGATIKCKGVFNG